GQVAITDVLGEGLLDQLVDSAHRELHGDDRDGGRPRLGRRRRVWRWAGARGHPGDRKSTRLNSSHVAISYAVFCLKKKKHHKSVVNNRQAECRQSPEPGYCGSLVSGLLDQPASRPYPDVPLPGQVVGSPCL